MCKILLSSQDDENKRNDDSSLTCSMENDLVCFFKEKYCGVTMKI